MAQLRRKLQELSDELSDGLLGASKSLVNRTLEKNYMGDKRNTERFHHSLVSKSLF